MKVGDNAIKKEKLLQVYGNEVKNAGSERYENDKNFFIFAIDKKKQIWYNITLYYNSVLCRQ